MRPQSPGDVTPFTGQIFMTVMGHFPEDRKEIVEIGCHGVLRVEFDYEYFDDLPTGASIARIRFHFDPASVDEVDGGTLSGSLEAGGNRLEATLFRVRNDIDCDGAFDVPGMRFRRRSRSRSGSRRKDGADDYSNAQIGLAASFQGVLPATSAPGNWGFRIASPTPVAPVPSLTPLGVAMLSSLLALAGWRRLAPIGGWR